jgi:2-amino-4-hydroxy-6-hydroxymethyldihydropteridine diphosphokinase
MNKAFLLLGGNIGDREKNFETAKDLLGKNGGSITRQSSLYETEAWGKNDQPAFLNQAVEIETELDAKELMEQIFKIEKSMGRERKEKYGPRLIDIDILLFNQEQRDDVFLTIPHPQMQNRRFVLVPLVEIAPRLLHPILKKTIGQLLKDCPDNLEVKKYH